MNNIDESVRLEEARTANVPWRRWGPYLSERQWGTVREDYSEDGNAWDYFPHDHARSRAYRGGEDGLAGISDDKQLLCFGVALWNGRDPILKERLFGLTNGEGNHGEDVKEYYFYLDNTPTHSYMKYLYKYPHASFPYDDLVATNRRRSRTDPEYELLDTGVFNEDRYFDIFVEYAKPTPEDILVQISAFNRGSEPATLHVLPTIWFRNTWTWSPMAAKPTLREIGGRQSHRVVAASHALLGERYLYCEGEVPLLFTENETNNERIFGTRNPSLYVKDGINDYVVNEKQTTVNAERTGTKAAAHYKIAVGAGDTVTLRLRLSDLPPATTDDPFQSFAEIMRARQREADEFYCALIPDNVSEDKACLIRQALAGMLWSKQYFNLDLTQWLKDHGVDPMHPGARAVRNSEWFHMVNDDIISMPDKWEFPWYAAWDLAFHAMALSMVDLDFAKEQLELMLQNYYLHATGQIPAYEWNFSDVNPPVHAWATIFVYRMQQAFQGQEDLEFLKRSFAKLLLNFTWWVNRHDRLGRNLFSGGFLGLDNIGIFDRSAPLPTGGHLEQADGTAWVALFCQNMLEIGVELAAHDSTYEDMAIKFLDHLLWIAHAMNGTGVDGMWDEEDGFYYDVLCLPDGSATRLKVRSMVGLLPLCATTVIEPWQRERVPRLLVVGADRLKRMPELRASFHPTGPGHLGVKERGIFALLTPERLRRVLSRTLDENEFLSPYGIRALSRWHAGHPSTFYVAGNEFRVTYLPGESDNGMFGGNSNWRGPVWMPMNALLVRSLLSFYSYYGDSFKVECPTGSGKWMNLFEVAREIVTRLTRIFLQDESGHRPVYGRMEKFQTDPHWKDYVQFFEYFHGDNGFGLGASHQTGWTGLIATLIDLFERLDEKEFLETGKTAALAKDEPTR